MKNTFLTLVFLSLLIAGLQAADGKAKNVILMIGDGMGFNSDLAGTYYRYGEGRKQSYHLFPVFLGCSTFSRSLKEKEIPADCKGYNPDVFWEALANANQGTEFTKTTDSAASSTAFNSGIKTLNGKIGCDVNNKPIELISEVAKKLGKKTGTVTTVRLSDATPAGFSAHVNDRGSMDKIFLQMSGEETGLTVVMGAGHPNYDNGYKREEKKVETEEDVAKEKKKKESRHLAVGGIETWEKMQSGKYNGYSVIHDAKDFEKLAQGKDLPEKVIGVAHCAGDIPPVDGFVDDLPETKKYLEKAFGKVNWNDLPTLTTMSLAALNVLNQKNDKGFVLLIEGGAIDHANHSRNIKKSVCEHAGFTKAVDAVIDWVEKNSSWDETLLITTADHETGQIWGEGSYKDANENGIYDESDGAAVFQPVKNNGRGKPPGVQYGSGSHTNALVPLWAKGTGATLFNEKVRGTDKKGGEFWNFSGKFVDDTDIFNVIKTAINK